MKTSRALTLLLVCAASLFTSCGKEKLIVAACRNDSDCEGGNLCDNYQCVPREAKACEVVIDGNPILQPSPHAVDFGRVDTMDPQLKTVSLHNIGNCTLTLFEANLGVNDAFSCDLCDEPMPREIWPGRSLDLNLAFQPKVVGESDSELVFLSDDKEYPTLRVPVHANYIGTPNLVAAPNPVDFGYVAEGRALLKLVQLTNVGTGVAPVTITGVTLSPAGTQDFSLGATTTLPKALEPISLNKTAMATFEVRYHPRSLASHAAEAVVATTTGEVRVPLSGNSATPPKVSVNPTSIELGDVPLGASASKPLTIVNEGGAPLVVKYTWGGTNPSTDLWATPAVLPAIDPGRYLEMQVAVTATQQTSYNGLLVLTTNDPSRPSMTIPVTARGVPGTGPAVVKIEMFYENGSDSTFDDDVRNVDMALEHPYGYVCNKQNPNPTNWGNFGHPSWLAFAPKEEPERIILADAMTDGTWRVMLTYQEDCSSIPTALLAGLLGISVDVLIDYLSGGTVPINGGDVARLISQVCLQHKASGSQVRVFVNGAMIAEKNVSIGRKGDSLYVLDLVRTNGTFTVR